MAQFLWKTLYGPQGPGRARRLLILTLLLLPLALLTVKGWRYFSAPNSLRVALIRDSANERLMQAVAQVFREEKESLRLKLLPFDTEEAAADALKTGKAELAVLRGDGEFPSDARLVASLYKQTAALAAAADSHILAVEDFKGKRILLPRGAESEANRRLLLELLKRAGLTDSDVRIMILSPMEIAAALPLKLTDGAFFVDQRASGDLDERLNQFAAAAGGATLVPLSSVKNWARQWPPVRETTAADTLLKSDDKTPLMEFSQLLMASSKAKEALVTQFTHAFFSNRVSIANKNKLIAQIEPPPVGKGGFPPTHPAAAAYFEDKEQSFFDIYGNYIYIGAMILSVIGSAIAAAGGRLIAARRNEFDDLLQKTFNLIRSARAAPNFAALERLEQEIDEILIEGMASPTIKHADAQKMTFLLGAIDQARCAARARAEMLERDHRA